MSPISLKRISLALGLVLAFAGSIAWVVGSRRQREVDQMMQSPAQISRIVIRAVQMWQADNPGCPNLRQLQDAKVLDSAFAADRWGSSSLIECGTETIKVHSLGPDRQLDTADDVLVSQRK